MESIQQEYDFSSVYSREKDRQKHRRVRKNIREHKRFSFYRSFRDKNPEDVVDQVVMQDLFGDHKFRQADWGISHACKTSHKKYRIKKEKGQKYPCVKDWVL